MASLSDSAGGRAGAELMAAQFHLKMLHAIVAVRVPRPLASPAPASERRRDRSFHLSVHDPPAAAAEQLELPSPSESLVVDIYLAPTGSGEGEVVERWTVACEPWPEEAAEAGEGLAVNRAYKRCIMLLRSVYTTLRLLPAYRVFRLLCASSHAYNYEMGYRVGSFAAPFSRAEEAAMSARRFVPIDTQLGSLVVSVQYLPSLATFSLEISSLVPPVLIPDYVGSPAAERIRAFPSSLAEVAGSSFRPSMQPQRPHSWTTPALWPQALSQQPKFSPPPVLSTSPTPSLPTFLGRHLQSRPEGETSPVSIPQVGKGRSLVHRQTISDPSRGPLENSHLFHRAEGPWMANPCVNFPAGPKVKDSKDESGRFSGVTSSCGSPQQHDFDDADYHFALDDVAAPDSRPRTSNGKDGGDQAVSSSHRSQDAAVGRLIHLLNTARPLRDPSYSSQTSRASPFMSQRTSDAIEELQSFRAIRESLLSRSRAKLEDPVDKP